MADHPRGTDNLMTSLKVISRVRQHEKVSTTAEVVRIDENKGYWQSLTRWWKGESRENNLQSLYRIVDEAFSHLKLHRDNGNKSATNQIFTMRLEKELRSTAAGLENLKTTYEGDSVILARIDLLIDRIQTQLSQSDDE